MSANPRAAPSAATKQRRETMNTRTRTAGQFALPKNEKGGIVIDRDELKVAWDFFDVKGAGKLTVNDIKKRLSVFYKNLSVKEVRFLLNNQNEITFDELYNLLKDNQLTNFDPVKEAFKVYDPLDTGFVDMNVVKEFFKNLGYGDISEDDAKILLQTADADKDGRIGLEDFRMMVPFG
uniref:EF-hand domain-containing protein n=1 Tax=Chromera velia CCMP2878 TaxID=1169474 RepID=A0A0G4IEX6_9ALVE|eukprot:Cvel_13883.t1-p1 / transcript=Cvel_13883.t1 / gene=Cvel_13883 / organism=Chromera_velia_CCMP2878 / gene_product=Calcium-binding protein CML19, putative / transcript_product=Calcium-binding protein CML19, putative / location=Cvel_scaffold966:44309-46657(+) / protein_length=177 / sequence_SO=supercontig / SO=protein_coding / is_pseudo=false